MQQHPSQDERLPPPAEDATPGEEALQEQPVPNGRAATLEYIGICASVALLVFAGPLAKWCPILSNVVAGPRVPQWL